MLGKRNCRKLGLSDHEKHSQTKEQILIVPPLYPTAAPLKSTVNGGLAVRGDASFFFVGDRHARHQRHGRMQGNGPAFVIGTPGSAGVTIENDAVGPRSTIAANPATLSESEQTPGVFTIRPGTGGDQPAHRVLRRFGDWRRGDRLYGLAEL